MMKNQNVQFTSPRNSISNSSAVLRAPPLPKMCDFSPQCGHLKELMFSISPRICQNTLNLNYNEYDRLWQHVSSLRIQNNMHCYLLTIADNLENLLFCETINIFKFWLNTINISWPTKQTVLKPKCKRDLKRQPISVLSVS